MSYGDWLHLPAGAEAQHLPELQLHADLLASRFVVSRMRRKMRLELAGLVTRGAHCTRPTDYIISVG